MDTNTRLYGTIKGAAFNSKHCGGYISDAIRYGNAPFKDQQLDRIGFRMVKKW